MRGVRLGQVPSSDGGTTPAVLLANRELLARLASAIRPDLLQLTPTGGGAAGGGMAAADPQAAARCRCLLDAVPGVPTDQQQLAMSVCMQDPDAFEGQVRGAGFTPACGGAGGAPWYTTTGGKVALGVGVLAVLGVGFALTR